MLIVVLFIKTMLIVRMTHHLESCYYYFFKFHHLSPLANGSNEITADTIYRTTGQASPEEIQAILEILNNSSPEKAFTDLREIQQTRGIALQDMIEGLHDILLTLELDNFSLAHIIQRMAEIEYRLAKGCADDKQLAALVAAFIFMRESQISRDNDQVPNVPNAVSRIY